MKYSVRVLKKARAEISNSYEWYQNQSTGIGEELLREFDNACVYLQSTPKLTATTGKYREIHLARFPFVAIYRIDELHKEVIVVSFFHLNRNPSKKPK